MNNFQLSGAETTFGKIFSVTERSRSERNIVTLVSEDPNFKIHNRESTNPKSKIQIPNFNRVCLQL